MEEILYKQLFLLLKQLLHDPKIRPILVSEDNHILNFFELLIEECWRVYMEKKHNIEVNDE